MGGNQASGDKIMSSYQTQIAEIIETNGLTVKPRHVEAVMRLQYDTLDYLPFMVFVSECFVADAMMADAGEEFMDNFAATYN